MKTFIFLFLVSLSPYSSGVSIDHQCRTDEDCVAKKLGVRCVPQKTGCPGKEAHSTCVYMKCDPNPAPTKFTDDTKKCEKDSDCGLIVLKCLCMYCARPDDVKDRIADAINRKYLDLQKDYACSSQEQQKCATAGPCAEAGKSVPVCVNSACTLKFEPRK